jgi:hypothetical protein
LVIYNCPFDSIYQIGSLNKEGIFYIDPI